MERRRGRQAKSATEDVSLVFADAVTGKIRGYAQVQRLNVENQIVRAGEVAVEAMREPNLNYDKYIDLDTGEMYPEAPA